MINIQNIDILKEDYDLDGVINKEDKTPFG